MLPSKLKIVCCHISRLVRKHLLCKIEVWNFKVTTILGRACDEVQRASPTTAVAATLLGNPHDTGYLPDPRIPLYNNLSRLLLAVSKRCLPIRLV